MLTFPDFAALARPDVWLVAVTIAIVASLETLLSIDAMDQLDPYHRITPKNRELLAQGTGNGVSSLLGGLPITAVIVRSTANLSAGATSRVSTIFHGALLLVSVAFAANLLNEIPLASLAAILIMVGFKLTRPSLYVDLFKKGYAQFIPFIITVLAILFTDLLTGIIVGMAVGLLFIVRSNFHRAVRVTKNENQYLIRLNQNVTFLNKAYLRQVFRHIPEGAYVIIDGSRTKFIDNDILETLENFEKLAELRGITVERKRTMDSANPHFRKMEAAA
jgi:MFS superfamily sulfate permease-like transporter